jgi:hypothetical protein
MGAFFAGGHWSDHPRSKLIGVFPNVEKQGVFFPCNVPILFYSTS